MSRSSLTKFAVAAALTVAVALPMTPAFAARKGNNNSSTAAACSVSPGTVSQYSGYTVNGTGLPAGSMVNVYVSDRVGTQWSSAMVDGAGNVSTTGYASYTGGYTVSITSSGRQATQLASCTFQAV
jgi:hypothetical protein